MKHVVIYNPASGSNYSLEAITTLFQHSGLSIDYSFPIHQINSKKIKSLVEQGVVMAVVGGDGSLNSAATLLVNTPSVFMPLPGGTFNHFTRDLGIPPSLDEAVAVLKDGVTKRIDVAYVNDQLFLNNSNIGLYPFSLIERKLTKKLVGKWIAAVLSIFDQLSAFRRHTLIIDGKKIKSPFIFVGNNTYDIERSLIPQRTDFDSGRLTVMIATSSSRLSLIRSVFAVMRGDVSHREDFTVSHVKKLTIDSKRKSLPVSYDGEVTRMQLPLKYRIEPQCIQVLVPNSTE
jgi:diacylglycerol kinase family enzyme